MPAASDILRFMHGQLFQTPRLPSKDFTGQTVVITGANTGLGYECARHLARANVSILVFGCRDLVKGEHARQQLLKEVGRHSTIKIEVWEVDMASYDSVKQFAQRVQTELPRIDALIANAGISTNRYHTAESHEETLTVNVTSTVLLSMLCLPTLERTARESRSPAHLTVVGSNVHCFADHTQLLLPASENILHTLSKEDKADMAGRYFLSKLIVMLCLQELAKCSTERAAGDKLTSVIINCPSPGWCKTDLFRVDDGGFMGRNILKLIGRDAETGSRTLVSAIAADEHTHGQYLSECQVKPTSVWVRSPQGKEVQQRLWKELLIILENISPAIKDVLV